jgi:hypothetical protein
MLKQRVKDYTIELKQELTIKLQKELFKTSFLKQLHLDTPSLDSNNVHHIQHHIGTNFFPIFIHRSNSTNGMHNIF